MNSKDVQWVERWYGSGDAKDIGESLCRGSHIYTVGGDHVVFLGDTDKAHELCTTIVQAHNKAVEMQRQVWTRAVVNAT